MIGTSHGTSEAIATCPGDWNLQFSYDHEHQLTELGLYVDEYVGDLESREHRLPHPLYLDSRCLTLSSAEDWWPEQDVWVNDRLLAVNESPNEWVVHPFGFTLQTDSICVFDVFVTFDMSGQTRSIRLARQH